MRDFGKLCAIRPVQPSEVISNSGPQIKLLAHHRKTPILSTCAVARKSPVGEKLRLIAMLGVRKASMSRPVGRSNVRTTESEEETISHLESAEKACTSTTS